MEPTPDLTLLADGPFSPEALDLLWQPDTPLPAHAQSHIDARWSHYLAQAETENKSLFNAPITRLVNFHQHHRRLALTLAPTDYKTFLVTVLRDRPWFQQHAPDALRPALGNSAFLTHRHRALLGIRSPRTSAYAHRAHVLGGVLELLNTPQLPATPAGLLTHLRTELLEEAAITPADLAAPPTLLFLARDEFLAQPELVWHCELATDLDTIAARLHPDEHHGHLLLSNENLSPDDHARMTPLARVAWDHWRRL